MQIDTDKVLTTKDAAKACNVKPGDLTAFVTKHAIVVPRLGKTYLWTPEVVAEVRRIALAVGEKKCIHCGLKWDRPDGISAPAEVIAEDEHPEPGDATP